MPSDTSPRIFGNYNIHSLLGRGGMAEVYLAEVRQGVRRGQRVALKRLLPQLAQDPEYLDLFTSEADLTRQLEHPNIVKVYEVGVLRDVYYMVMEWIDGKDLGQILRRCREKGIRLPVELAVYLGRVLLEALEYAHTAQSAGGRPLGIVHCDVSPSNLFISKMGEVKLGDFGVARAKRGAAEMEGVAGKPNYVSPEMMEGEVDLRADLWAANVTLFELLTGQRPFSGNTAEDVFRSIGAREWRRASELRSEVSDELSAVLERGFAPDPAYRYQSAAEFSEALAPHFDERVGTPLAIASVVRGLFRGEF